MSGYVCDCCGESLNWKESVINEEKNESRRLTNYLAKEVHLCESCRRIKRRADKKDSNYSFSCDPSSDSFDYYSDWP